MNAFVKIVIVKLLSVLLVLCSLMSCVSVPDDIVAVKDFKLSSYLGRWYEIARLDHSFERNLNNVSASYSLRDDGGVEVINRGFNVEKQKWQQAIGKAYFVDDSSTGYLKVSFFGPFYGAYIVFELDELDYQYAFVTSSNKSYLWLLARQPIVSDDLKDYFLLRTKELGFDQGEIVFVDQSLGSVNETKSISF